jgi:hypothetical protein
MNKNLVDLWGKVVFYFLCASVALVGIGRVELPLLGLRFSSWSVSRTAFFFWLAWKLWVRAKQGRWEWNHASVSIPLFLFVGWVTASLLPDFKHVGDYRYFIFGFAHYLMVTDVFRDERRQTLLYYLLGITPGFLLFRGILSDPSVLNLSLTSRFAYPLDHANIAGHLFSMSIPLCLAVVLHSDRWIRPLAGFSVLSQFSALIFTFSRNSWIACSAALLSGGAREKNLRNFVSVLAIISLAAFAVSSELRDRVWSLTDAIEDPRVVWRIDVMTMAISLGLDSPFLGNGYGRDHLRAALSEKYPEFSKREYVGHSHSLYTELICGVGVLGLAVFLWLLASACIYLLQQMATQARVSKAEQYTYIGLLGSLIAFVVGGLADVPLYHHETRIFFFTLLGLIQLRLRTQRAIHPRAI